jgi:hypothetical protein
MDLSMTRKTSAFAKGETRGIKSNALVDKTKN